MNASLPHTGRWLDLALGLSLVAGGLSAFGHLDGSADAAGFVAATLALHVLCGLLLCLRAPVADRLRLGDAALSLPSLLPAALLPLVPDAAPLAPGLGWALLGLAVTWLAWSLLSLGRRFAIFPLRRPLASGGAYRLVRHPIYLGYLLLWAACLCLRGGIGTAALAVVCLAGLVVRLLVEERRMAGPAYEAYRAHVRFRLVPGLW